MTKRKAICNFGAKFFFLIFFNFEQPSAMSLSPNGYSGLGLIPSAKTLESGQSALGFDTTVPGARITTGYNSQIGFGLTDNVELVGRLATNNQKCNMFALNECPPNTYRDFSSSMKWSIPFSWLKNNNSSIAVGATDFGGAATYFRSYYLIGAKSFKEVDISLGLAKAKVATSMLDGAMASVNWRPTDWANVSIQKIGPNTTAHALLETSIFNSGAKGWVTLNHKISSISAVNKSWLGWGVSIPLDSSKSPANSSNANNPSVDLEMKTLAKIKPAKLINALKEKGFYNIKLGTKNNGQLILEIENTSYAWNILDAAGVALGVISGAYSSEANDQYFELILTTRGIKQIKVTGEANCVGLWLSKGLVCSKLAIQSLLQNSTNSGFISSIAAKAFDEQDASINWTSEGAWQIRPEIVMSPTLVSAIGTEFGSFDFDMGANINTILPLWAGATLESNRLEPLGIGTRQFEQSGAFFGSRLKGVSNRKLFHQLVNLPDINTQARLSAGTAYSVWNGRQIETSSQSDSGRHKLGYSTGYFKNSTLGGNTVRNYDLINYRYVNNDQQTSMTEITYGKFWAGDKGFSINQRFWYGDTTLNAYFRRTRMSDNQALVSFAGLQLAIPFTPRENKSLERIGFRGVSQWTYSLESKVLEKDNIITGGYGEVPRVGESLITTFNRDRNSSRYYDTNLSRIRNAFLNLGNY